MYSNKLHLAVKSGYLLRYIIFADVLTVLT